MRRRAFLQAGIGTTLTGMVCADESGLPQTTPAPHRTDPRMPDILISYTAADHRRRLENIQHCERSIRRCMRKHLVTDYLPGQCVYNLGEYPCRKPWTIDEYDERELDRLRDHGIRLIQVHEDWNDALRLFGGDKYSALDPTGFQRFVKMVHARGMRLIVYLSSGFIFADDPDCRPEWSRGHPYQELYWNLAWCSPASAGWRAYLLPRLSRILDEYGVDGIYNDLGYRRLAGSDLAPTGDEVLAFEERDDHDAALEDLLALMYAEVKRRGGIVKIHQMGSSAPRTSLKVYDYLWVGEGVKGIDNLREASKNHSPYVVPCVDLSRTSIEREDDLYLHSIPYMQFPLLQAGRPFTGERSSIPGIRYYEPENNEFSRHIRAVWQYAQEHPEGPFTYGWWDSVPGRPEARPTHARWLRQYHDLTEEGTRAYLEITDSDLFRQPLPKNVVASVFANRDLHLVLANYGTDAVEVATREPFSASDAAKSTPRTSWTLNPRSLLILRRLRAT